MDYDKFTCTKHSNFKVLELVERWTAVKYRQRNASGRIQPVKVRLGPAGNVNWPKTLDAHRIHGIFWSQNILWSQKGLQGFKRFAYFMRSGLNCQAIRQ